MIRLKKITFYKRKILIDANILILTLVQVGHHPKNYITFARDFVLFYFF